MPESEFQDDINAVPGDPLYDEISRINNELINIRRQLEKKNLELARLNDEKNRFLGMAAHDLRNPLNAILSFSDFLLEETSERLEHEHVEFLEIINSSSSFMLNLVDDLLDVAKIESGKLDLELQPVDMNTLLEHNVSINRILAEKKHIALKFYPKDPLPATLADPSKLEQVFNNLISNAVKFSHHDSVVIIEAKLEDNTILLSVTDQGDGIPPDELNKLFKPFSRTSIKSTAGEKSSGLGLAIARRIVEGHQGQIWVESKVGQGTTFFVSFPIRGFD